MQGQTGTLFAPVAVPVKLPAMRVFAIYVLVSVHPVAVPVDVTAPVAAVHGNIHCLY